MKYQTWHRTVHTPGHKKILVLVNDDGRLPGADDNTQKIQCATLERLPFMLRRKELLSRYRPEVE